MASLLKDKNRKTGKLNGCRMIQFVDLNGKRKVIRLGKMSERNAQAVRVKVEALIEAAVAQTSLDAETTAWVRKLDPKLHGKIADAGLVSERAEASLAAFIDGYIEGRSDVKLGTRKLYLQSRRMLVDYFGAEKPIADISAGDVEDWSRKLQAEHADNTARRRLGVAKQFFRYAVRKRLITESPFAEITGTTVRPNHDRDYFITREEAAKVLDACPTAEWRLIVALSRFGGLRCPSDIIALRWIDIDWAQNRMTIRSSKTEHHEGGGCRVTPLFSVPAQGRQMPYGDR